MPDIFDRAQDHIERTLPLQLAVRKPVKPLPAPNGKCRNCAEPVEGAAVYCDDDCRADFEHRLARGVRG